MTEKEKALIKIEIYKAWEELPKHCDANQRFVIALKFGLERAQRKLEENRKE